MSNFDFAHLSIQAIDKNNPENNDIGIDIDKDILENIHINIDIHKDILENIDIHKKMPQSYGHFPYRGGRGLNSIPWLLGVFSSPDRICGQLNR